MHKSLQHKRHAPFTTAVAQAQHTPSNLSVILKQSSRLPPPLLDMAPVLLCAIFARCNSHKGTCSALYCRPTAHRPALHLVAVMR